MIAYRRTAMLSQSKTFRSGEVAVHTSRQPDCVPRRSVVASLRDLANVREIVTEATFKKPAVARAHSHDKRTFRLEGLLLDRAALPATGGEAPRLRAEEPVIKAGCGSPIRKMQADACAGRTSFACGRLRPRLERMPMTIL